MNDVIHSFIVSGVEKIDTDRVVDALRDMGFTVSADSIMDLLHSHEAIHNATVDEIELSFAAAPDVSPEKEQEKRNQERVSQMAKQAMERD